MTGVPHVCPACGSDNKCALARSGDDATRCWCMQVAVRADLPPRTADTNAACFCPDCATGKEKAPVLAGAFS